MWMNAMIVESFGIRGGKIHEVERCRSSPFHTTAGSGR
jgi:hypothetical protein